jgi:hypothetical protein
MLTNQDKLTGEQFKELQTALLDAFPSRQKMEQMVRIELHLNLDAIAGGSDLTDIYFNLIEWAEAQGRTAELVTNARKFNAGNPTLKNWVQTYFPLLSVADSANPIDRRSVISQQFDTWIGLYYPYIHFRDESWLKLAALYWDKMGRIVPHQYETHDSDIVKQLKEEVDFIENVVPDYETDLVGQKFLVVLVEHEAKLRTYYGLDAWFPHLESKPGLDLAAHPLEYTFDQSAKRIRIDRTQQQALAREDAALAFVHFKKMGPELFGALEATHLAALTEDEQWVGMHPKLVTVYMTALANEMAARKHYHPLTNNTKDHIAVTGYTPERLTQALLGNVTLVQSEPTAHEIIAQMANIALRFVAPKNIAEVPLDKIIELRDKRTKELANFQGYIKELVDEMPWLYTVDPIALESHLKVLYRKQIKPHLDEIEALCRSMKIETIDRTMNVRAVASELPAGDPVAINSGEIALNLQPSIIDKYRWEKTRTEAAAAYLFHVNEQLKPNTLGEQISQQSRQLSLSPQ